MMAPNSLKQGILQGIPEKKGCEDKNPGVAWEISIGTLPCREFLREWNGRWNYLGRGPIFSALPCGGESPLHRFAVPLPRQSRGREAGCASRRHLSSLRTLFKNTREITKRTFFPPPALPGEGDREAVEGA